MPEIAQAFHLYWGMLLAMLIVYGAGGWSIDRLLVSRLRQ
jgi:putative oxidoreductase